MTRHGGSTRRQFAGSVVAVVGAGLAGCIDGALEGAYSSSPEDTPVSRECEREHQEAPDLSLRNRDSSPHTVTVVVTGVREDGTDETVYEERFVLEPDQTVDRDVVFDPDEEDIETYEDYVATATSGDGQSGSTSIYDTVVTFPLRYDLNVEFDRDGELVVSERHSDQVEAWTPAC